MKKLMLINILFIGSSAFATSPPLPDHVFQGYIDEIKGRRAHEEACPNIQYTIDKRHKQLLHLEENGEIDRDAKRIRDTFTQRQKDYECSELDKNEEERVFSFPMPNLMRQESCKIAKVLVDARADESMHAFYSSEIERLGAIKATCE